MKNKFILCGTAGWCMEILFTSLHSLVHRDYKLSGKTSIWMFPIYGMASILAPLFRILRGKSVMIRGSIYACLIFAGEFCSGSLLKKYDLCPWDYSNARFNVRGLIRLDYAPLWFGAGLFFERLLSGPKR